MADVIRGYQISRGVRRVSTTLPVCRLKGWLPPASWLTSELKLRRRRKGFARLADQRPHGSLSLTRCPEHERHTLVRALHPDKNVKCETPIKRAYLQKPRHRRPGIQGAILDSERRQAGRETRLAGCALNTHNIYPVDIPRFAGSRNCPMQPYHAIDDGRWADKRIGGEIKTTYAFRSLDAGAARRIGLVPVADESPGRNLRSSHCRTLTAGANGCSSQGKSLPRRSRSRLRWAPRIPAGRH
jgi:hypothetical protein